MQAIKAFRPDGAVHRAGRGGTGLLAEASPWTSTAFPS